ncbi:VWA domain-containing protein [Gaiella sp.]|uniref:VWA domain-containing protein n=1 Tax=Gaiella sp. TaxID=2663207 RepID=UPI00326344E7
MTFGSPLLLVSLVVPVAATLVYLWIERTPPSGAISFPNLAVVASIQGRSSWRRHLVAVLVLSTLILLCVSVARPKVSRATPVDRSTVVLVVDVSVSMNAVDVTPSRLEAARKAIGSFVDRVPPQVKIGLIAFSDEPVVLASPTTDKEALRGAIASLAPGYGTAIGDAVARGVDLVRLSTGEEGATAGAATKAGAVVLLSDGSQTRGILDPLQGADIARQAGIPVHTIALGTQQGTVTINRGGVDLVVLVPPDRLTLARIAEATGASTFEATDADRLAAVYKQLGRVVATEKKPREVTSAFVLAAASLLAAGIGLAGLWAPRLP